jgi:Arm DNA-binding domain
MARYLGKLTALFVARAKQPGLYSDGGNLYLQVESESARSWIFRYAGRYMGLGSALVVSLQEARDLAHECRKLRRQGIDPIGTRRAQQTQHRLDAAKAITFKQCAEGYIKALRAGWRDAKHVQQWENTIAAYAEPIVGALPVQAIDTALMCKVLEPIWTAKPETASRVRGRIERILDWAKVRGYRDGENPARWRGHLDHLLPHHRKVKKVKHHAALPYADVPAFIRELHTRDGVGARALEFAILTATRSGEALGAKWNEFDLNGAMWTVPAARHEKRQRTSRSAGAKRAQDHQGYGRLEKRRICFSWRQSRAATGGKSAVESAASYAGPEHHSARFSIDIPRLGSRANELCEPCC